MINAFESKRGLYGGKSKKAKRVTGAGCRVKERELVFLLPVTRHPLLKDDARGELELARGV
jgi:hypothetical protein